MGEIAENHRRDHRRRVALEGTIAFAGGRLHLDCSVVDVGTEGARLRFRRTPEVDGAFTFAFDGGRARPARRVWSNEHEMGIAFD